MNEASAPAVRAEEDLGRRVAWQVYLLLKTKQIDLLDFAAMTGVGPWLISTLMSAGVRDGTVPSPPLDLAVLARLATGLDVDPWELIRPLPVPSSHPNIPEPLAERVQQLELIAGNLILPSGVRFPNHSFELLQAIIDTGGIRHALPRIPGLQRSTASDALRRIESILGAPLFDRSPGRRRLTLTPFGSLVWERLVYLSEAGSLSRARPSTKF